MQETFDSDLDESCYNVFQNFGSLLLAKLSLFLEDSTQIALVTELGDNVAVIVFSWYLKALENVMMLQGL